MWKNPDRGASEFRANGWRLVVKFDPQGVRLLTCRDTLVATAAQISLPQLTLPACCERYIRGDALHLVFSDTATETIGVELVLMPVEAEQDHLVLESVISLKTSLLDSYPAVELQVGAGHPGHPRWATTRWEPALATATALSVRAQRGPAAEGPRVQTTIWCDDRDQRSLNTQLLTDAGRLCFFGDFLEKGVIRRVQPWWVWSQGQVSFSAAARIAAQLAARPLPLAS
jgi:hypothetical protein